MFLLMLLLLLLLLLVLLLLQCIHAVDIVVDFYGVGIVCMLFFLQASATVTTKMPAAMAGRGGGQQCCNKNTINVKQTSSIAASLPSTVSTTTCVRTISTMRNINIAASSNLTTDKTVTC
jgi:type IV secretory pathway TrbL component